MVVTDQELVGEDRRENLGLIVGQSTMPDARVQFEQRFQPTVERFDRATLRR